MTGFIQAGASGADLLLIQEHHLEAGELAREAAWARSAGWTAGLVAAPPTGRGGTSGGVGALTRSFRGLARGPGWRDLAEVEGRVSCHIWNGGGVPGGLVVVSVYLECGVGMNETNWAVIRHLAVELGAMGRPFVIGGDWQQSPDEMAAEGVFDILRGVEVVCAEGSAGTCCTRGTWATLDWFLISRELSSKVVSCSLVLDAALRPHRPVALRLRRGGALPLERVLAAPRTFPSSRPIGAACELEVPWNMDTNVTTEKQINERVAEWFDKAEAVIANLCFLDGDGRYRGRGGAAQFRWVRPQVRRMGGRAKTSVVARAWYWLGDRLGELSRLQGRPILGNWEHRCGLTRKLTEWMPPTGQIDVKELWLERLRHVQGASSELLDNWKELAYGLAEAESTAWVAQRRRQLREWVAQACAGSGRGAHRFTKAPLGWRPDPCDAGGKPRCRQERVDDLAEVWRSTIWNPKAEAVTSLDFDDFEDQVLIKPTVQEVKAAAKAFPEYTGLGVDQWHPR